MEWSSSACNPYVLPVQGTGGPFRLPHRAHLVQPGSRRLCCCQRVVDSMVVSVIRFSMRADVKTLIKRNPIKDQRGFSLIDVMLSIALLGILAVSFLGAIGTGSMVLFMTDERQTAKNLAESQMEYVKNIDYIDDADSYEAAEFGDEYAGYSVEIEVEEIAESDENIQKITVIIQYHGEEVTRLEGYKAKR